MSGKYSRIFLFCCLIPDTCQKNLKTAQPLWARAISVTSAGKVAAAAVPETGAETTRRTAIGVALCIARIEKAAFKKWGSSSNIGEYQSRRKRISNSLLNTCPSVGRDPQ